MENTTKDKLKELDEEKEEKIKKLISKLQKQLNKEEIIAIVYNPLNKGIKDEDSKFLKILFDNNLYSSPLFILSGPGGDFVPGLFFPHIIKEAVKSYKVYVPSVCGSALCYTILKANELWIGSNTKITQIDPTFEYKGEVRRAIKVIKDINIQDIELKQQAREIFYLADYYIKQLCASPSVFKYKCMASGEFQHLENVASVFMNKQDHETPITKKDLVELEVNLKEINDENQQKLALEFLKACQDYTISQDVRVIFVSSVPIKLEKGEEGSFICPLN